MKKWVKNTLLIATTGPIGIGYSIYDYFHKRNMEKEKSLAYVQTQRRLESEDEKFEMEMRIYRLNEEKVKELDNKIEEELNTQYESIMNMNLNID